MMIRSSLRCQILFCLSAMMVVSGPRRSFAEEGSQEEEEDVQDTTLDGTGEAAAKAANKVEAEEEEKNTEAKADQTTEAKAEENTEQETTAEETAQGDEEDEQPAAVVTKDVTTPTVSGIDSMTASNPGDLRLPGNYGQRRFGQHRYQIAISRPVFDQGQKCYSNLYGATQTNVSIVGDWFPKDWAINPGLTTGFGFYTAGGTAAKPANQGSTTVTDCTTLTPDYNSPTTLVFIPIQVGLKIEATPFSRKFIVLDAWIGGEYTWFQETRDNTSSSALRPMYMDTTTSTTGTGTTTPSTTTPSTSTGTGTTTGSTTTTPTTPTSTTPTSTSVYTNSGTKLGITTGFSMNILLNSIDETTVRTMVDSMGIGSVYISAFYENVRSVSTQGLTFGRNVYGVGFTFETTK